MFEPLSDRRVLAAAFSIGFSSVVTQVVLMREMLGVFAGNELVLGVVLGNWLLIMGLGATLGSWLPRRHIRRALLAGLVLTAVLPFAQVILVRGLRRFMFQPGESLGVVATVLASFALLLPYCLIAGLFLAVACRALELNEESHGAGRVYALDSLGSVVGGALFTFVLVFWLDHFWALCVPAVLNLAVAAWTWRGQLVPEDLDRPAAGDGPSRPRTVAVAACLILAVGCVARVWRADPEHATTELQFPEQRLLFSGYSPYGRLMVTESRGQTNIYENGLLVAASPNIEAAEESAHFAMAQRPGAKKVLLIGGLLTGTVQEILRYDVKEVHCVELDPLVTSTGKLFFPGEFEDPRIRIITTDARSFMRRGGGGYDVIIVALPDPSTAQLNRFFTREFFQETRQSLNPGGVLSFAVGRYENYASAELRKLLSCAHQTVRLSFKQVLMAPGSRVYFLASDGPVTLEIGAALERAGVQPKWVNRHYLEAALAPDRLEALNRAAAENVAVNRDFRPVLYFLHLRHWASQFQTVPRWVLLVTLFPVAYLLFLRGASCAIFASGYAGASLEVVLLLGIQVMAGAVYRQLGLVVTIFMAGLAVGALWATRRLKLKGGASLAHHATTTGEQGAAGPSPEPERNGRRESLRHCLGGLAITMVISAVALPPLLFSLTRLTPLPFGEALAPCVIGFATFAIAFIAGAQFPIANVLEAGTPNGAGRLYTADFLGASIGALSTSTLLLPLIGVAGVCAVVGALNAVAALMVFRK